VPRRLSASRRAGAPGAQAHRQLYWNGSAISRADLAAHLAALGALPHAPALEIHSERGTRYDQVATLLVAARNADVRDIGAAHR
jgi:biopolymer transport protein ExbD